MCNLMGGGGLINSSLMGNDTTKSSYGYRPLFRLLVGFALRRDAFAESDWLLL